MKAQIKNNFAKASKTYHLVDYIQKIVAQKLAKKLSSIDDSNQTQSILDVGCGTGNLSIQLSDLFPNATYYLNDISQLMLIQAQNYLTKNITIKIIPGDIETITLTRNFDLISSNLCLQWLTDFEKTITKLINHSALLAFSFMLEGSFKRWYDLTKQYNIKNVSRKYPTVDFVKNLTNDLPVIVKHYSIENFCIEFDNAKQAANYLHLLGANTASQSIPFEKNMINFLRNHKKTCYLDYKIGFLIIKSML